MSQSQLYLWFADNKQMPCKLFISLLQGVKYLMYTQPKHPGCKQVDIF